MKPSRAPSDPLDSASAVAPPGRGARFTLDRMLWIGGGLWALIVSVIVCWNVLLFWVDNGPRTFGHDFVPSYAAGRIVRDGYATRLYDPRTIGSIEQQMGRRFHLATDGRFGPYLNPPFYALLFVPLAGLPYQQAANVWLASNVALLGASLVLLGRMLGAGAERRSGRGGNGGGRHAALIPLLLLTSLPFWLAFCHQQNTFLSLALLTSAVACWRGGRPACAGVFAGLLFFKPQLAAVLAVLLVLCAGRRALAGLAMTGTALLLVNLIALPGTLTSFLHGLPPVLYDLQMRMPFNWGRQCAPQAFWRLMFQGHAVGDTVFAARLLGWLTTCAFAAGFGMAVWRAKREMKRSARAAIDPISRDRLIAAALASMPLLVPYYMDYDLLLLAVPAVLYAADRLRAAREEPADRSSARADRCILAGLAGVYFWPIVEQAFLHDARWHLSAPFLALAAIGLIARCFRPTRHADERTATPETPTTPTLPLAA